LLCCLLDRTEPVLEIADVIPCRKVPVLDEVLHPPVQVGVHVAVHADHYPTSSSLIPASRAATRFSISSLPRSRFRISVVTMSSRSSRSSRVWMVISPHSLMIADMWASKYRSSPLSIVGSRDSTDPEIADSDSLNEDFL